MKKIIKIRVNELKNTFIEIEKDKLTDKEIVIQLTYDVDNKEYKLNVWNNTKDIENIKNPIRTISLRKE